MEDAVIVSAVRTPVGSFGGQFKDIAATELGAHAVRAELERAEMAGEEVDEVVLGSVLQAGLGQNPARQAAIGAGIPKEVPGTTINMVCGSGLKAVAIASQMIRAGDVDIVVAGGYGEHDAGALPCAQRSLWRSHGRHADDRLDDP